MAEADIPGEVRQFIKDYIRSLFQLEVLLLLHRHRDRDWSPEDIDRELKIGRELANTQLADLHSIGLLTMINNPLCYRYRPATDELDAAVSKLATAYKERRVSVTSLIYSTPVDEVRIFAEAFRLRKDK